MNQSKLEEIRQKSLLWFANHYGMSVIELSNNNSPSFKKMLEEKFIELVIIECAEVVRQKNNIALNARMPLYVFPETITEHFGFHFHHESK